MNSRHRLIGVPSQDSRQDEFKQLLSQGKLNLNKKRSNLPFIFCPRDEYRRKCMVIHLRISFSKIFKAEQRFDIGYI